MLWLYDEFETDFTYNGIVLNNAYDSDIHWVLNTMYKLTFKYPTVDNDLYSFIEKGMIVKADEHDRTNLFRIKDIDISENDKCITVTAYQKNYDFSKRLVNNFSRVRVDCMSVLDEWYSQFLSSEKDFSYYSDISDINSFSTYKDEKDSQPKGSFELLGEIASLYSADIDMHDKQISLLRKLGRDTEEVLTTAKNISEFVNTSNSDEIVTRIYATTTFRVGDKDDKKDLQARHREELRALRQSQKEYSQSRNAEKKSQQIQEEIAKKYAKELAKQNKSVKRSGTTSKSYSQIESEVRAKYQVREQKAQVRRAESQALADRKKSEIESLKARQKDESASLDEEITISLIIESPLINDYPFINEISISNNDLRTAEELEEWAMEYFTKQNIDKPKNSIKVTYEQLSENINRGDTVILKYLKYGVDERIRVVETHYDPMLKKWKEFILGEKEGRLGSEVSHSSSGAEARANAYTDLISMDIERKVKERSENYDKLFKKNTDEINKKIEDGFEKAKASSEVTIAKIDEDLEKKLAPIRNQVSTTVENYNRQFQATNLEISKNRVEATKQIQALTDRVNNIQDISNNETVVELRGLVNGATSKVTELETSITREFTAVKKKNEDSLNAVKAEFTKGVDGLTSKISSLEEYKNQDGSRTESLKQWVQRDTASQLSRERTEINRVIDSKGFVKNTEFSSKFTESARGITNQLSALENYKNQDGVRVANLQIWAQNNTANQLTAARRSIESWVNEKGYVTNSVVENKVRETANSFSREISNVRNSIPTSVGGRNYVLNSEKLTNINFGGTNWERTVENGTLVLTKVRATDNNGFWIDIMGFLKDNFQNEVLTWSLDVKASKNISFNNVGQTTNGKKGRVDITTQWQRISHTFTNRYTNYYAFIFYGMIETCSPGDKIYIKLPKLEKGNVATDWTPAPEDVEQNVNELNTWKQTATETLNTVSSGLNDSVRHSQLQITADSINFGSNKVFDGRNLASMLSVSPESINAITDKLVITPANENLIKPEYRRNSSFRYDIQISEKFDIGKATDFLVKGKARTNSYENRFRFAIKIIYKDETIDFVTGLDQVAYINGGEFSVPFKIKPKNKEIKNAYFTIDRFGTPIFDELSIVPQKSAELIVDGTIEGKKIKSSTIETGHLKAGSVTANIIATDAIESKHLKVSDAMIDKLVGNQAFVTKLWARDAFINNLGTVKIKSTQIDTNTLKGAYIQGGTIQGGVVNGAIIKGDSQIKIGEHGYMRPSGDGLRFCLPEKPNAKKGVGVQMLGNYGRDGSSAYGLYVYIDPNFDTTEVGSTNSYLMTVNGYIKTTGINNLKFQNYTDNSTSIGLWNQNVSLLFDNTDNDIFYQWKGRYSLWGIIKNYYNTTSDARLKKDIKKCGYKALDLIDDFNFKSFNWKYHEEFGQKPFTEIGLIAQDVEKINKNFVTMAGEYKTLNQFNLLTYSLKAIQELSTENKELKQRIIKLEEKING